MPARNTQRTARHDRGQLPVTIITILNNSRTVGTWVEVYIFFFFSHLSAALRTSRTGLRTGVRTLPRLRWYLSYSLTGFFFSLVLDDPPSPSGRKGAARRRPVVTKRSGDARFEWAVSAAHPVVNQTVVWNGYASCVCVCGTAHLVHSELSVRIRFVQYCRIAFFIFIYIFFFLLPLLTVHYRLLTDYHTK